MPVFIRVLLLLFTFLAAGFHLPADDHVIYEATRTYMGRTTPVMTMEYWYSENKAVLISQGRMTIYRYDLGKRWLVLPELKRYFEESLPASNKGESKDEFRIQDYGFRYQKNYHWRAVETGKTELRNGKNCREVILYGEDDYSEETRQMWLAVYFPVNIPRFFKLFMNAESDPALFSLFEKTPILRQNLLVEGTYSEEPPIAPTIVWNRRLVKAESIEAPSGIYEIPEGMTKVNSLEELYAR